VLWCLLLIHFPFVPQTPQGLNFKRKGLIHLLDQVERGDVKEIVVTYKDRLARFGVDLLERTFRKHETTLHVVQSEHNGSDQQELADDLLAVCNFFVAKNNGRRAAALRRSRQQEKS